MPTDTYFLTFCMPSLPAYIKVGFERVPIKLYIPSPLRCFKCQQYGHTKDRCDKGKVCAKCAQSDHGDEPCAGPHSCVNCKGAHPSFSKSCPTWIKESAIQQIKTERKIPFFEARKLVEQTQPVANLSYAEAAKAKKPATRSIGIQADDKAQNAQFSLSLQRCNETLSASNRRVESTVPVDTQRESRRSSTSASGGGQNKSTPSRPPRESAGPSSPKPSRSVGPSSPKPSRSAGPSSPKPSRHGAAPAASQRSRSGATPVASVRPESGATPGASKEAVKKPPPHQHRAGGRKQANKPQHTKEIESALSSQNKFSVFNDFLDCEDEMSLDLPSDQE